MKITVLELDHFILFIIFLLLYCWVAMNCQANNLGQHVHAFQPTIGVKF